MVVSYLQGLKDAGVTGCIKHFPGHGDTKADTHFGYAQSLKTWAEMLSCEMTTFKAGIAWGAQLIMTAHIATPNVTGTGIPATMSSIILQDKLRGELGYRNIIITDGMEMGAITQQYTNAEAAVGTLLAGADIVLGPQNFVGAFDAVIKRAWPAELRWCLRCRHQGRGGRHAHRGAHQPERASHTETEEASRTPDSTLTVRNN